MGNFEKTYILPLLQEKSSLYLRFIDDIFFLWNGTEEELKSFINRVNLVQPTIKFETNYSYTEINFLDTTVKITSNNELVTALYKKETDRNTFLHRKSYHLPSTKKSISYSQALRISRICSDDNDYHKQLEELKDRFIQRGYRENEIIDQLNKATQHNQNTLLKYKTKEIKNNMVFLTKYHNQLPNIGKAIDDNWNHLHINAKISSAFTDKPIVAYKHNDNLRSLIGQHRISGNKVIRKKLLHKGKCTPCRTKRGNLYCQQVKETSTFTNRVTKKVYKIFHQLNYKSKFCIYLLEYTKCHDRPYVGKFETHGNERINNH